jgi:hypothetical protein
VNCILLQLAYGLDMKIIPLATFLLGLSMTTATGQTQKLYDQHGNYRGKLSEEGSRIVVRDQNGNPHGSYRQEGDKTVFRDNNGNPRGYAVRPK